MKTGNALLGVLGGIAVGTVIGMILAPNKGSRLKKAISRKSEDLADAISDKIDEKFEEFLKNVSGRVKKANGSKPVQTTPKSDVVSREGL